VLDLQSKIVHIQSESLQKDSENQQHTHANATLKSELKQTQQEVIRLTNDIALSQARIGLLEKDLGEVRAAQESRSQQFRSSELLYMQQIEELRGSLR
jgi:predicted  nucleic acid-binding Zn-ribbon protein